MMDETRPAEIVEIARLMAQQAGPLQRRQHLRAPAALPDPDHAARLYKPKMAPDDLVIVDEEGTLLAAREGRRPTSEMLMHLEAYRQRPVRAVLHAHPPYATALTIAGLPYPTDFMP